jgi:uncharacterized protein YjbI with pentapeptide repeats
MEDEAHLSVLKQGVEAWNQWRGERTERWQADLSETNLIGADLRRANLRRADLTGADLIGADLSRANLREADLTYADLSRANLREAKLFDANLCEANLSRASLGEAQLGGAFLYQTNLSGADLTGANLIGADLREAYLSEADLTDANLTRADLSGAKLIEAKLGGASLWEANLGEAQLARSYLTRANLINADLSRAILVEAKLLDACLNRGKLREANLIGADLREAELDHAALNGAKLIEANLRGAKLTWANLSEANLREADLSFANLRGADLHGADLREADLREADLLGAFLDGANLQKARLGFTVFGNNDLSSCIGLDSVRHDGPSTLGVDSIILSKGGIPRAFLRGVGLPDEWIDYIQSLVGKGIQFFSCFISYSSLDKPFAVRLHDALQSKGIRCWLDEKQLLPGHDISRELERGIYLWDKVLLCASKNSLTSTWVEREIKTTLAKEEALRKERGKLVLKLIPLDLDGFMSTAQWDLGVLANEIRSRKAADFRGWETDNAKFNDRVGRVITALRADEGATVPPPPPRL